MSVVRPLGSVEPHAGLLTPRSKGQLLYKIMTVENLLRSINAAGSLRGIAVDSRGLSSPRLSISRVTVSEHRRTS